jgi:antitoxin PrlF
MHYLSNQLNEGQRPIMNTTLEVQSTLTDRYQTTVPETVRRALKLGKRDKIHYSIRPGGEVVLTRAEAVDADDPALGPFLAFLETDIARNPSQLRALDAGLAQRLQSMTRGINVNLNNALTADDE